MVQHLQVRTAFLLVTSLVPIVLAKSTTIIRTSSGPVQGEILTTISEGVQFSSFKGIRYAEAPVGYLRFKPPVPARPWQNVFAATADGNGCPRFDLVSGDYTGDEDCLFLNVYTPLTDFSQPPREPKAVMVWIHGGALLTGSSNSSFYGPDFLMENDVVVVTFNYRLGALGFLALGHPEATGNAGFKDQNLVLRWVQRNIMLFGGHPQRVTLFGHSAGGFSVNYHILSEMSAGLFSGAISMSGVSLNPWSFSLNSKAQAAAIAIASQLGVFVLDTEELLAAFYDASAYDLVVAMSNLGDVDSAIALVLENPLLAINDQVFMSTCSVRLYELGHFARVPYMIGFTASEALNYIGELSEIKDLIAESEASYSALGIPLPVSIRDAKIYTASKDTYQASRDDGSYDRWIDPFIKETTDLLYKTGADQTQVLLSHYFTQPVYYYQMSFTANLSMHQQIFNVNKTGPAHGDDMAYLWWISDVNMPLDKDDPISIIRKRMTRMWTNFAKYKNPTPYGSQDPTLNITWPMSGALGLHLEISDELSVQPRPIDQNIAFIEELSWPVIERTNGCSQ